MPRYKFQWDNLPQELALALSPEVSSSGNATDALKKRYGARPSPDFIQETWQVLMESWLSKNQYYLSKIALELRSKGLGDVSITSNSDYLSSCRNTVGLRSVVLNYFLDFGEHSDSFPADLDNSQEASVDSSVSTGYVSPAEQSAPKFPASCSMPDLVDFALEMISEIYNVERTSICIDKDGDILIPSGSACVYIHILDTPPAYTFFSQVLTDIPGDQDSLLLSTLNEINRQLWLGRFVYVNDIIILEHALVANGTNKHGFAATLDAITTLADKFDHLLQARFGGKLFFREPSPDAVKT